jgi:hypothetical protein
MVINFDLRRLTLSRVQDASCKQELRAGNLRDSFRGLRPFT